MRKLIVLVFTLACSTAPRPVSTPEPLPTPPTFRLPGDVVPTSARVEWTILPTRATAPGHVGITATVRHATRAVWLNATELDVSHATLNGIPARVIPGGEDFVGLLAERTLSPGPLQIEADFVARIDHVRSRGLYAQNEGAETYAYTFFEATDARRAFPCFDEPAYKIPWQLTFHVQRDQVALGNAPVTSEAEEPGGLKRVVLEPSKPLPSYLVAFAVGPFEIVDDGVAGRAHTPVRFVVPRGRAGELGYAKEVTPRIVAALEDYFDMPYPYLKLDVAVVPRYWGTMEHPGLLAMGQPLSLIRPDQATRERRQHYANIAAHELAHYWFGDYVTMAWWDDTWLNEALGSWMDPIITDAVEPSWRLELDRVDRARTALAADESLATRPIRQQVTSAQDIQAAFDTDTTYLKGSSVFRMFEAYLGRDTWRNFMRTYVRAHAWGNATADELFSAVRERFGQPVEAGLRSFIEQPGVPRISATLRCDGKPTLALHQSRALRGGERDPHPTTWTVPVCVRYAAEGKQARRACTILSSADGTLPLEGTCPAWVLTNADGAGYYRSAITHPHAAAALLTPGSAADRALRPTAAEKLMAISDFRSAVDRDELGIDASLELAPRSATDGDPRVALAAVELGRLRIDALPEDLRARAIRYQLGLLRPLFERLGWKRRPSDSDDTQALRRAALRIASDDPKLADQGHALALRWFDDRAAMDDDLFGVVFQAATAHGDQALFDRIRARAKDAHDREEQARLLVSLGGFVDPGLLDQALAITAGTEFDLRDSIGIVYHALGSWKTQPTVLRFLESHLDGLLARMRDDEASRLLGTIAASGCDPVSRDAISALVQPRAKRFAGAEQAVAHGLATSAACIATAEHQLPAIRSFLAK